MIMNTSSTPASTRYCFPSSDGTCASATSAVGDRTATLPRTDGGSRAPPPGDSALARLAVRVSRAKWMDFLRRVFHYQNSASYNNGGDSRPSDLGPNPFDSTAWMALELAALIVQVGAATATVAASEKERPVWPMRMWIVGYDIGCLLSLLLLFGRFQNRNRNRNRNLLDIEQQQRRGAQESRTLQLMNKCRTSLDLFFAIWFVMGNVWVFDSRFGSFKRAPKLHVLCISILTWNAITYSFPFLLFLLLCCCVPLISVLVGYNISSESAHKGASDHQISQLPTWNYNPLKVVDDHSEDEPECCICLAKYKEKEEVRELPCSHMFHLNCVDQWLRILSSCPLCKQELHR